MHNSVPYTQLIRKPSPVATTILGLSAESLSNAFSAVLLTTSIFSYISHHRSPDRVSSHPQIAGISGTQFYTAARISLIQHIPPQTIHVIRATCTSFLSFNSAYLEQQISHPTRAIFILTAITSPPQFTMSQSKYSKRYYAEYERGLAKAAQQPKSTPPSSTNSSRTSSTTSLQPASPVAEWCHQIHMIQNKKYQWCEGCHPRPPPPPPTTRLPSQKMIQRSKHASEPSHAYQ